MFECYISVCVCAVGRTRQRMKCQHLEQVETCCNVLLHVWCHFASNGDVTPTLCIGKLLMTSHWKNLSCSRATVERNLVSSSFKLCEGVVWPAFFRQVFSSISHWMHTRLWTSATYVICLCCDDCGLISKPLSQMSVEVSQCDLFSDSLSLAWFTIKYWQSKIIYNMEGYILYFKY